MPGPPLLTECVAALVAGRMQWPKSKAEDNCQLNTIRSPRTERPPVGCMISVLTGYLAKNNTHASHVAAFSIVLVGGCGLGGTDPGRKA